MNKVIVVGSVNMDITARTDKLPDTGETVAARSVEYLPGGKGLNQAVAAAKIGTTVVLAGCLGSDSFADELASFVRRHKIDVSCLRRSEKNSGIALITVDERGQNTIVVAPGSNADVCPEDVKKLPVSPGDVVVCQFEIPPAAVAAAFAKARRYGARTILNPSPVCPIPDEIFRNTDILIVNETELAFLSRENVDENTPAEKIADAAEKLKTDAEQTVIVTLGSRGALVAGSKDMLFVDSYKVPAVDTCPRPKSKSSTPSAPETALPEFSPPNWQKEKTSAKTSKPRLEPLPSASPAKAPRRPCPTPANWNISARSAACRKKTSVLLPNAGIDFINPGVIIVLPSIKCQRSVPAFTEPDKKPCRAETGRRSSALFFSSVSKKSHLISLLNVS